MLDCALEYRAGPAETVAGIEQGINLRSPYPLLDLVEIAVVRVDRAIGHLVEGDVIGLRLGHGKSIARALRPPIMLSSRCSQRWQGLMTCTASALRLRYPSRFAIAT
jgi:hypothetical protein